MGQEDSMTAIEFDGVSKRYSDRPVLTNLSFQVDPGERVVIFGPSGCGKTTILRLLAGFLAPDSGSIRIGGELVAADGGIRVGPEYRNVGMVFQDLALWPHLTVYQNLEFTLKARRVGALIRKKRIDDMVGRVRLAGFAGAYPAQLSGGQQQRVAIARALVAQPLILLMDEPLSNLDDDLRHELSSHLLELHAVAGFTLVYITHNKEEARKIGTRTIVLSGAKEVQYALDYSRESQSR
jgi:ABC-type Fe3+/spermidine/putrescine transport system ATPase subunit